MNNISCRIEKRIGKLGIINKEASYWLDSQGRMNEWASYGINKLLFKWLVILLFIVALIFMGVYFLLAKTTFITDTGMSKNNETHQTAEKDIKTEIVSEPPSIGEKCSNSYLTYDGIKKIYEQEGPDQLQFYINLIYARHGYVFKKGSKNDLYFNKLEWYQKLEKGEVCYEDLNEFEKKNVDLLSTFLEEEGYRK